jgi:hypothetical protein
MKYPKKNNILKYILFFAGLVVVFLVVRKIEEGFQTGTLVELYFNVDNATRGPTFIKSTDSRVKYVSSAIGGTVVLNIDPSLESLQNFNGSGWSQANKWVNLPVARLDNATNALRITTPTTNGNKLLHNPTYNRTMLSSTVEVKLPQAVTNITLAGIDTATFGLGTNAGDPANNYAKIKIMLYF